ncbi:adenylyltransferase/sulfurtransferase [Leucobacter exalbidus]|uniref:Adenylyltransferase/sulfurtransferase n=1 Tax=Leucobacter exalbidus TaxID=662960 RepID=A0A940T0R5_9MICO|nr:ThiF family adenylyltransferase [Leucobacter exalbidus]MBP1326145.1 adenylyltransferase/sulfurtransferase [Leucobacter exalbidus]
MTERQHAAPGPAVQPGPPLTAEQRARAERQLSLPGFSDDAQRRLANARVLIIGAGGLGSASVPYLVGSGVGSGAGCIGILDDDVVELSNLHRQVTHPTANLGKSKTDSLAEAAKNLDPAVNVVTHTLRLTADNAREIFAGYDLVIDGSDNFPTRYLANDAAQLAGIPLVWGALLQHHGQVGVAWHAHGPGYRDLFPTPPEPGTVPSCAVGGVLPGLCGTVGSLLATEALKVITGIGAPLIGRVLVYDALAARTREIGYARDPQAAPVTQLIDYELFCAGPNAAQDVEPERITATELADLLRAGEAPALLDVRTAEERAASRITGAIGVPLADIEDAVAAGSPLPASLAALVAQAAQHGDAPLIVHCARDPRSVRAAQLLARGGVRTRVVTGGIFEVAEVAPELIERNA